MNTKKQMTFVFDHEVAEAWIQLHAIKNLSFSEFIKEVLARENLKYSTFSVTESINKIAGTLKTQLDYKRLRDNMIDKRLKDYENIC